MSATTQKLTNNARLLRNASPQAFDNFITAFSEYTADSIKNLVFTTENRAVAQGQAQQCQKILDVLEEAKKHG